MALSVEFEASKGGGLFFARYKSGVLNVADYSSNMAFVHKIPADSPEIRDILKTVAMNDETGFVSLVKQIANDGDKIN